MVLCRRCDRGNVYCITCSPQRARERIQRAQRTYRRSPEGQAQHRDEERARRARRRAERDRVGDRGPAAGDLDAGSSAPSNFNTVEGEVSHVSMEDGRRSDVSDA